MGYPKPRAQNRRCRLRLLCFVGRLWNLPVEAATPENGRISIWAVGHSRELAFVVAGRKGHRLRREAHGRWPISTLFAISEFPGWDSADTFAPGSDGASCSAGLV